MQIQELTKWEPLSAEVTREAIGGDPSEGRFSLPHELSVKAYTTFSLKDFAGLSTFNADELADCIRTTERIIADAAITIDDLSATSLRVTVGEASAFQTSVYLTDALATGLTHAFEAYMHGYESIIADLSAPQPVPEPSANTELSRAA
jgi:hypothetical protein